MKKAPFKINLIFSNNFVKYFISFLTCTLILPDESSVTLIKLLSKIFDTAVSKLQCSIATSIKVPTNIDTFFLETAKLWPAKFSPKFHGKSPNLSKTPLGKITSRSTIYSLEQAIVGKVKNCPPSKSKHKVVKNGQSHEPHAKCWPCLLCVYFAHCWTAEGIFVKDGYILNYDGCCGGWAARAVGEQQRK